MKVCLRKVHGTIPRGPPSPEFSVPPKQNPRFGTGSIRSIEFWDPTGKIQLGPPHNLIADSLPHKLQGLEQ